MDISRWRIHRNRRQLEFAPWKGARSKQRVCRPFRAGRVLAPTSRWILHRLISLAPPARKNIFLNAIHPKLTSRRMIVDEAKQADVHLPFPDHACRWRDG